MYKNVIFDVDGTLIDTEKAVLLSLQKLLLEEMNREFSFEALGFVLGIPGEAALKKLGISNLKACEEKWNRYLREFFHSVKVFDEIEYTLKSLKGIGISTGIVTSKTREEYDNDFMPFGLCDYFGLTICADDTRMHKPDPEPILKFIELSGTDKSETLYIGDTCYDMECARSAGVDFGLALWGAKTTDGIEAEYFLKSPKQILEIVK